MRTSFLIALQQVQKPSFLAVPHKPEPRSGKRTAWINDALDFIKTRQTFTTDDFMIDACVSDSAARRVFGELLKMGKIKMLRKGNTDSRAPKKALWGKV